MLQRAVTVAGVHDGIDLLVQYRLFLPGPRMLAGQYGEIVVSRHQRVVENPAVPYIDLRRDQRIEPSEVPEDRGEVMLGVVHGDSGMESAADAALGIGQFTTQAEHDVTGIPRGLERDLALRREAYPAARAYEQRRLQLLLQQLYPAGDGRLGDMQEPCGLRDIFYSCQCVKEYEVLLCHGELLSISNTCRCTAKVDIKRR